MEVYFDPAYTVTQGGIIFGTTSPSPGFSGTITTPPLPSVLLPGDYNNDGYVDPLDYQLWRGEFSKSAGSADGNGNGIADAADYVVWRKHVGIGPVATVGRLAAAGISVPEPSVAMLTIAGICVVLVKRESRHA